MDLRLVLWAAAVAVAVAVLAGAPAERGGGSLWLVPCEWNVWTWVGLGLHPLGSIPGKALSERLNPAQLAPGYSPLIPLRRSSDLQIGTTVGETLSEATIIVNDLAQGLLSMDDGLAWFTPRTEAANRALLRELAGLSLQAGAVVGDVPASITISGIRTSDTPAVLLSKGRLAGQLAKVGNLPEQEFTKAFRLLIALLGVADERRRISHCGADCSHWWHHLNELD